MPNEQLPGSAFPSDFGALTQYIFHNYFNLLTADEKKAWAAAVEDRGGESKDPATLQLLSNGPGPFFKGVRDRVLKDHEDKISLNRCPKCGAIARTPEACLCPSCNHTWYELRKKRPSYQFPDAATGQSIIAGMVETRPTPLFSFLDAAIQQCSDRVQKLGGSVIRYEKSEPASAEQVARVAARFEGAIPLELLELGRFANHLEFLWHMDSPDAETICGVYSPFGQLAWDFDKLGPMDPGDFWWAEEIVSGETPGEWHNKVIVDTASDGDFLAYSIDPAKLHVPMYCAHDGSPPVELVLGESLESFFRAWMRIGFLDINEFYEWPRRTGQQVFDVSYFQTLKNSLAIEVDGGD